MIEQVGIEWCEALGSGTDMEDDDTRRGREGTPVGGGGGGRMFSDRENPR
jgi:hypothetical protein